MTCLVCHKLTGNFMATPVSLWHIKTREFMAKATPVTLWQQNY